MQSICKNSLYLYFFITMLTCNPQARYFFMCFLLYFLIFLQLFCIWFWLFPLLIIFRCLFFSASHFHFKFDAPYLNRLFSLYVDLHVRFWVFNCISFSFAFPFNAYISSFFLLTPFKWLVLSIGVNCNMFFASLISSLSELSTFSLFRLSLLFPFSIHHSHFFPF